LIKLIERLGSANNALVERTICARDDREDAKNAHARVAGVNSVLFKNLFVSAGGDNILNKKRRGGYVGMGVRFEDEDFKYLLGTLPRISTQ
jgi:phospholipid/cholesterol/gamma-HCH transport system substrate-binding protein